MPTAPTLTYKVDWASTDFMTYDNMNRIENNISAVADFLRQIQYPVKPLVVNTARTRASVDFLTDIKRIEQNLDAIQKILGFVPSDYAGEMKVWTKEKTFDYTDANRLELNTKSVLAIAQLIYQSFRYSGAYTCGGGGLY